MSGGPKDGIYVDRVGDICSLPGRDTTSRHGHRSRENVSKRRGEVPREIGPTQPVQELSAGAGATNTRMADPRRRVSALLAERQNSINKKAVATSYVEPEGFVQRHTMKRRPRRMTIYIPSEDTTIQTIHPRMISCNREASGKLDSWVWNSPPLVLGNSRNVNVKTSGESAKKSAGSVAARRVPLQTLSTLKQETIAIPDRFGNGGGKENIPPAELRRPLCLSEAEGTVSASRDCKTDSTTDRVEAHANDLGYSGRGPTAASRPVCPKQGNRCDRLGKSRNLSPWREKHGFRSTTEIQSFQHRDGLTKVVRNQARDRLPKDPDKSAVAHSPQRQSESYPLLSEISRPELYEEDWLAHQEAAITQLVNCVFESFEDDKWAMGLKNVNLTKQLVHIYHEPPFPRLNQQLQASLLHGALNGPKGINCNASELGRDVGLRREFLDLWIRTYEPTPLQAAIEAVVGRRLKEPSEGSDALTSGGHRGAKQRTVALRTFLDVFLLRSEDLSQMRHGIEDTAHGQQTGVDFSRAGRLEQRTVLRSLLLILLLDKAKQTGAISSCLFLPSSPHKSSVCVLNALKKLLLPSVGDVHRALRQLGYGVHHVQQPLQEYRYRIENLATDLRDGVRLTHLVELLLYPSAATSALSERATGQTPDNKLSLYSLQEKNVRALSSRTKLPCTSKPLKLHNVQIALDALCSVTAMSSVAKTLRAHDIVDGHREKTVGLLWALISRFGLGTLVDWKELEKETGRLQKRFSHDPHDYEIERRSSERPDEPASALLAWAGSIAHLHQLNLENIPAAFADGKIFEKIVDEYAAYLPCLHKEPLNTCSTSTGLQIKLRRLGCNRYFGTQPLPTASHALETQGGDVAVFTSSLLTPRSLDLWPNESHRSRLRP